MYLVAFQKKRGGLTVMMQCTTLRTQSNLVIGTWCYLVVLGGTWWYLVVLDGTWCTWWYLMVLDGTWCTWWYLVEYLEHLVVQQISMFSRNGKVAQSAFQQPAQSVETTKFE